MPDLNRAIHIPQRDPRSSSTKIAAHVVAHPLMIVHFQTELVIDSSVHGGGFNLGLGVGRNSQFHTAVYRRQFKRRISQPLKLGLRRPIDGGQLDPPLQPVSPDSSIDAGSSNL